MILNKECCICKQIVDIRFFYKSSSNKGGYKPSCKLCFNLKAKSKSYDVKNYYEINGKYYLRSIRSFIRDDDEATNDIRHAYSVKPSKMIDIWKYKRDDDE